MEKILAFLRELIAKLQWLLQVLEEWWGKRTRITRFISKLVGYGAAGVYIWEQAPTWFAYILSLF